MIVVVPIPEGHQLKINAFIDHSSLEVFINDGELNFSCRIYPHQSERDLRLFAINQQAKLENRFIGRSKIH